MDISGVRRLAAARRADGHFSPFANGMILEENSRPSPPQRRCAASFSCCRPKAENAGVSGAASLKVFVGWVLNPRVKSQAGRGVPRKSAGLLRPPWPPVQISRRSSRTGPCRRPLVADERSLFRGAPAVLCSSVFPQAMNACRERDPLTMPTCEARPVSPLRRSAAPGVRPFWPGRPSPSRRRRR
jgi:hypothetical protein